MRLPINPSYGHSNQLVLYCNVLDVLQVFILMTTPVFHSNFAGVPVGPDRRCWGQPEQKPYTN